jgi:hypothetical protein
MLDADADAAFPKNAISGKPSATIFAALPRVKQLFSSPPGQQVHPRIDSVIRRKKGEGGEREG